MPVKDGDLRTACSQERRPSSSAIRPFIVTRKAAPSPSTKPRLRSRRRRFGLGSLHRPSRVKSSNEPRSPAIRSFRAHRRQNMDSTLPTSRRRWHDHAAGPVSVPDPSHNQCRDHAGREIAHLSPGAVSLPEICPCCRNITPLGCRWKPPSPSLNHKRAARRSWFRPRSRNDLDFRERTHPTGRSSRPLTPSVRSRPV